MISGEKKAVRFVKALFRVENRRFRSISPNDMNHPVVENRKPVFADRFRSTGKTIPQKQIFGFRAEKFGFGGLRRPTVGFWADLGKIEIRSIFQKLANIARNRRWGVPPRPDGHQNFTGAPFHRFRGPLKL